MGESLFTRSHYHGKDGEAASCAAVSRATTWHLPCSHSLEQTARTRGGLHRKPICHDIFFSFSAQRIGQKLCPLEGKNRMKWSFSAFMRLSFGFCCSLSWGHFKKSVVLKRVLSRVGHVGNGKTNTTLCRGCAMLVYLRNAPLPPPPLIIETCYFHAIKYKTRQRFAESLTCIKGTEWWFDEPNIFYNFDQL